MDKIDLYDVNEWEHRHERLLRAVSLAYLTCKYIDSTQDYGLMPDSIREHIAEAYSELVAFRRRNMDDTGRLDFNADKSGKREVVDDNCERDVTGEDRQELQ